MGFLLVSCVPFSSQPTGTTSPTPDLPVPTVDPSQPTPTTAILFQFTCIPTNTTIETGVVTYIVDGDSIFVEIGGEEKEVRYIGIDAPEMDPIEPGAEAAAQRNAELVTGKTITLVRDVSEVDPYDRLLRYVLVDNVFVNYELVNGGYAQAKRYWPDVACYETLQNAQGATRLNPLVILPTDPQPTLPLPTSEIQPTQAVLAGCSNGCTAELSGCSIKGNISLEGEKIYHLPGMNFYDKTKISPEYGERWFCSEDEAVANGWRKALR
ncbi:MAG TPA: thermonuclease family protein [Bellilinea sp.]|nr:thermonuclease family protein [Bellilinea sp.]